MSSALMVARVSLDFSALSFSLLNCAIGTVRKVMGVNFLGETREEGKMYIVDTCIEGIQYENVRPFL